jgi:chromosome segregation ATPase
MTPACERVRLAENIHDALCHLGYDGDHESLTTDLARLLQGDGWRLERGRSEMWRTEIGDLRAGLADAQARIAALEAELKEARDYIAEQNQILREMGGQLRDAENDAYEQWSRG